MQEPIFTTLPDPRFKKCGMITLTLTRDGKCLSLTGLHLEITWAYEWKMLFTLMLNIPAVVHRLQLDQQAERASNLHLRSNSASETVSESLRAAAFAVSYVSDFFPRNPYHMTIQHCTGNGRTLFSWLVFSIHAK